MNLILHSVSHVPVTLDVQYSTLRTKVSLSVNICFLYGQMYAILWPIFVRKPIFLDVLFTLLNLYCLLCNCHRLLYSTCSQAVTNHYLSLVILSVAFIGNFDLICT